MGLLTGVVLALLLALPAWAAEATSQTYVVLVGISQYADQQIKPRPHAEADAKALFDGRTVGGLPPTPRQKEQPLDRAWGIDWPEDIDVQRTPSNVLNNHIFFHADVRHRPLLLS